MLLTVNVKVVFYQRQQFVLDYQSRLEWTYRFCAGGDKSSIKSPTVKWLARVFKRSLSDRVIPRVEVELDLVTRGNGQGRRVEADAIFADIDSVYAAGSRGG